MAHPHTAAVRATVDRIEDAGAKTDLFRLLVESIKDYAIFVLDPEGNILTWSPGAQAMKGYTRDEIIGKHFSKFYPAEAVQSSWPQRELAIAEKDGRFADEGWRVRKDGSTFWASVIITPLRSADGSLTGFAKITQDMTERRASEEKVHALNKELRHRVAELDEARRVIELRTLHLQNAHDAAAERSEQRGLRDNRQRRRIGAQFVLSLAPASAGRNWLTCGPGLVYRWPGKKEWY